MMYKLPYRSIKNILYYGKEDDTQSMAILVFISKDTYVLLNEMRIDHPFNEIPKLFDENSYRAYFPLTSNNLEIIDKFQQVTHSMIVGRIDAWEKDKTSMSKNRLREICGVISISRNQELRMILHDMVEPYIEMTKEEFTMMVMSI